MNIDIHSFARHIVLLFLLCPMASNVSHSKIFAYVDSDGKLIISDKREDTRYKQFDPSGLNGFKKLADRTNNNSSSDEKSRLYAAVINNIAQEVGVSAHLLHAVIQVESAYNPAAVSSKGAQGLMQLIPATAARFGVVEVHDPESNIRGGARYLKKLLDRFDNDLKLTLAAYNAGEGAVQKYKNTIPPYPETQAYVSRVLDVFEKRILRERNSS